MSDLAAIGVITLVVVATQVFAVVYLGWLADRRGLSRSHAVWGLLGIVGPLVGGLGILWLSRPGCQGTSHAP
jgi:hypothetical protein